MKRFVVGDKLLFAVQIEIYSEMEIRNSPQDCVWWGNEYLHGFLSIHVDGKQFGELDYFYPLQPTITCAIENPLNQNNYPGLMKCPVEQLFDAFDYAFEHQPDVEDINDSMGLMANNEIKIFFGSGSPVDEYMPNFLYEYVFSRHLSDANILIGAFAFQKLETIVIRADENIRFSVRDDKDKKVASVVLLESEYRSIWSRVNYKCLHEE